MTEENQKRLAKLLFIRGIMTNKEITEVLEISMQHLARWQQADNWVEDRKKKLGTKGIQLNLCYDQLSALNLAIMQGSGFPTEKESLTQRRLAATINELEKEVGLAEIINVAKEFCTWLRAEDVELGDIAFEQFDEFIHIKADEHEMYKERLKRRKRREEQEKNME